MEDKSHHTSDGLMNLTFGALKEITDDFAKERKLGSGTFGQVYKGNLKDGKAIAVKILRPISIDGSQFENELEILKKLQHQNIVQLVGLCNEEGVDLVMHKGHLTRMQVMRRALCLEFVPNGNIGKLLSDDSLLFDWDMRFKIIKGICQGVRHIHKLQIMHLDLKPDNILLDEEMVPKIVDFGISKLAGTATTIVTSIPLGTMGYIPPEFTEHQIISYKYDIFSLGIIIKKMVNSDIEDVTDKEFIEDVLENWKKRLQQIPGYDNESLEVGIAQVRTCIEIAADCTKRDLHSRPTMDEITYKLDHIESVVSVRRMMTFKDDEQPPRNEEGNKGSRGDDDLVKLMVKYCNRNYAELEADTVQVMVGLRIKETNQVREHLDVVAVLDVSESMAPETIDNMKTAIKYVVMKLTPYDRISIVTFSNLGTRLCPLRCASLRGVQDLEDMVDDLDDLEDGSVHGLMPGTSQSYRSNVNIQAGLEIAMAVLNGRVHRKARKAAIFLMSSGQQNVGDAMLVNTGKVSVYTFGFHKDADKQKLLSDIAHKSLRGRYIDLPDGPNMCVPILKLLLPGLLTLAAQDLQLTITPQRSVADVGTLALDQAFGIKFNKQTSDSETGAITIHFGHVSSGEIINVLFNIQLLPSDETQTYDTDSLALVHYSYATQSAVENGESKDVYVTRMAPTPRVYTGDIVNITLTPTTDEYQAQAKYGNEVRIQGPHTHPTGDSSIIRDLCGELQQLLGRIMPQPPEVHPYDFDSLSLSSRGSQRYTARGDNIFAMPRTNADFQLQHAKRLPEMEEEEDSDDDSDEDPQG